MTASPSTTPPFSSTTMRRSASPSSAMPRCAPCFRTCAWRFSGCSAPQPSLMFVPSGLSPTRDDLGAELLEAPRARPCTRRRARSRRRCVRPSSVRCRGNVFLQEDDVAAARVVDADGLADVGRRSDAQRVDRVAEDEPLDLGLDLVGELEAVAAEELDAVVLVRVVATPRSRRRRRRRASTCVMNAMPGVGSGPTSRRRRPSSRCREASACSSM